MKVKVSSETSDPNMELDDSDSDLLPSDLEPQEREDGEIEKSHCSA
ncbi:hypothetical protein RRG08_007066, partial [Elysia crispata]